MRAEELTIKSIQEGLQKKEFSAKELAQEAFSRIEQREPELHAFLNVSYELALGQTQAVDDLIAQNQKLPALAGVPASVKDAILVEGIPCTAGSRILENYIAPYDATVTQKLREAGAVITGKTNMDEFGMGASTENSAFGPTKNPHDPSRVPGGSSGGSAVSVAAGESVVSLGEDTGGSIRQPASFCGVVGLKPTYGAVSRHGIIALASSLDQVGPFGKTVDDVEAVFNVICGKDPFDSTSVASKMSDVRCQMSNVRIGVPKEYFAKGLDSQVEKTVKAAIQKFEDAGAELHEIELPNTQYALSAYYVINMSEASANLARYDSLRYGVSQCQMSNVKCQTLLEEYLENRGKGLGQEVKRRIMLGTYALSAGYYDAYYLKAQKVRTLLRQDFQAAFEKVDVIMGPTTPFLPFKLGERIADPLAMYLVDVYTVPVNLVGLPALSLPAGKSGDLPVGLHVIAPPFQEDILFGAGKIFESVQ